MWKILKKMKYAKKCKVQNAKNVKTEITNKNAKEKAK